MSPEEALAAAAARHGLVLRDEGPCPGGEVGARYARSDDGSAFVYKLLDGRDRAWAQAVVDGVHRLRGAGYPAARYLDPLDLGDGIILMQERAAGAWRDVVDADLITGVLEANDRQVGLGQPGRGWGDFIAMTLNEGADGYCLHETLRSEGGQAARILAWVRSVGRSLGQLPQDDFIHLDFHHRNILQGPDGALTVIDLEGCQPGDRAFDLVTFAMYLDYAQAPVEAVDQVWRRATEVTNPEALRAYVAHMALRRIDWTIRFHPEDLDASYLIIEDFMTRVGKEIASRH